MQSFKNFSRWYYNKNIVLTLEAMQKVVQFYNNKSIQMLELGSNLPNLANICLHNYTSANFYQFIERDESLLSKV